MQRVKAFRPSVVAISCLVLALCPRLCGAQSFGTQAAWSLVLRDVLGLDVAELTPTGVGHALCATGANITADYDWGDFRRIDTSGESGYKTLRGLQVVNFGFSDGRLSSLALSRSLTPGMFEQRFRALSVKLPLQQRVNSTFVIFQDVAVGVRMKVSLSMHSGVISEWYEGLMFSREPLFIPRTPKIMCSGMSARSTPATKKTAGDTFDSMDGAARAGLANAWKLQDRDEVEWSGYVYTVAPNRFAYALTRCPEKSTAEHSFICVALDKNDSVVAYFHTHPHSGLNRFDWVQRAMVQYFTLTDVRGAVDSRMPEYIRSTLGIRKLDPTELTLSFIERHYPTWFWEPYQRYKGDMICGKRETVGKRLAHGMSVACGESEAKAWASELDGAPAH